jgi:prophage antirepressor-like protein|nr:MAG TPA: repressor domain protein [Caudoviricetes sp.]
MAKEIQIFSNPSFGEIRTSGTSDEPLFCLADVCKVLDLQVTSTKNRLKQDGVNLIKVIDSLGREQNAIFVNEQNLYRVIMRSDKPQAEPFQDWVCGEVLPAIRKTGGYIATTEEESPEEIMAKALLVAQTTIKRKEERMKQLEAETEQQRETIELQDTEIKKAAPKVNYYDNHLQSVNTQTTTQVAKQIGMEAPKLNKKLKELGILYKQSGQWLLHSPYSSWGMHSTRTQTFTRSDGSTGTSVYTVWTTKGVRFIIALYENDWNVKKAIKQIKGEMNPAA